MMDWLSRPLPDFWAGIGLVAVGVIWFVLGTACVPAGYRECGRPALSRWNPRRWVAPCFSWWLGLSLVAHDAPVAKMNDARRACGDIWFVRDENDRNAAVAIELLQEREHFVTRSRVEIASGLVRKKHRRPGH